RKLHQPAAWPGPAASTRTAESAASQKPPLAMPTKCLGGWLTRPPLLEAAQAEAVEVELGLAADHQVGHRLADERAELEAVAREARRDEAVGRVGQAVHDEVVVGRVVVMADVALELGEIGELRDEALE